MDKIKKIYERIKSDLEELKLIAINNMYDDYFAKSKKSKYIIDSSISKEIGIRKIVGDSYYYAMLEDNIMLLLDEFISNNNPTNIKVPTLYNSDSPITIPNREYKRLSRLDMYRLSKEYIDGDYNRLDVYDNNPKLDDELILDEDYKEPLLEEDIKKISNIISKLDKCNYLGFFVLSNGDYHELYEYNNCVLLDFTAILDNDILKITTLEMSGNLWELENIK